MFFRHILTTSATQVFSGATCLSLATGMRKIPGTSLKSVVSLISHICNEPDMSFVYVNNGEALPGFTLYTEARLRPCIREIYKKHPEIKTLVMESFVEKNDSVQLQPNPLLTMHRNIIVEPASRKQIQKQINKEEEQIAAIMLKIGAPFAFPSVNTPKHAFEIYDANLARLKMLDYDLENVRWIDFVIKNKLRPN